MSKHKSGAINNCDKWNNCEIVVIPHVVYTVLGSGWIFPKQSKFLPIFKHYFNIMNEGAVYGWIYSSYGDDTTDRVCHNYAGKPIGWEKVVSLLGAFILGAGLSVTLLL